MHISIKLLKKVVISFLSATLVLMVSGLVLHLQIPAIKANNATEYRNQISTNSPLIIKFNELMNRGSVQSHFSLFPEVRGQYKWTLNKLTFVPEERLKVGETYTLTVSKDATNILGKNLAEDYVVSFLVVDAPKISLAVPNNETNVDSKITVMFDRPVVAVTTLDELDKKALPLTIEPNIKGRGKWIGTSAFQFTPDTRLDYSTQYTAKVPAGVKTVDDGVLENDFTFTFHTPRLALNGEVAQSRESTEPVMLPFNQEVQLQSVIDHVKASGAEGEITLAGRYSKYDESYVDDKGAYRTRKVEDKKVVEIMPKSGSWGYDNAIEFKFNKGIVGIEGNMANEMEFATQFATRHYLSDHFPAQTESAASPNGDVVLVFQEPVNLDSVSRSFSVSPEAPIHFVYGKKCQPDWEPESDPNEQCPQVNDLNVAVGLLSSPLKNLTKYTATLSSELVAQNGQKFLKKDEVWDFTTSDVTKVLRVAQAVPSRSGYSDSTNSKNKGFCVFSTTPFDDENLKNQFVFEPAVKRALDFDSMTLTHNAETDNPCLSKDPNEKYALFVRAFMDPLANYKITLKAGTKDNFKQQLAQDYVFNWKTDAIDERDISLGLVQQNRYAFVTPEEQAKPVFNAYNLDSFNLELCRMNADKFLQIDTQFEREGVGDYAQISKMGWDGFIPSAENCDQYIQKTIATPGAYWEARYKELDLRDVLNLSQNTPLDSGYYYLRASSPKLARYEYRYKDDGTYGQLRVPYKPDQILAVTNMHLAVKKSARTALVWANDLHSGNALNGISLKLYRSNGEFTNKEAVTDSTGLAQIAVNELPFQYIIAQNGADTVAVNTSWTDGIAPWDYNLVSSDLQRFIQSFLYTDRPIYQPTHTVHFKGIVRNDYDAQLSLPSDIKTISVEIKDSRDISIYKKTLPLSPQGTFNDQLVLAQDVPLGQYRLESCVSFDAQDGYCKRGYSSVAFYVEEYKKPEYKLQINYSKDSYVNGDDLNATLDADYYFGAPVPNAKVRWTLNTQNYYFDQYQGDWYSFSDYSTLSSCYYGCPYNDQYLADGEGTLDAQGHFTINQKLDLTTKDANGKPVAPDTSKLYTLNATVIDSNNQSVGTTSTFIVNRGEFYVGVKTASYIAQAGGKVEANAIAVDPKGAPLSGKSITLQLVRNEWKYVKKKNVDGGFYWDNEVTRTVVDTDSVTTDGDGKASANFKVPKGGEYLVTATGTDSHGNSFTSSMDFYATTSDAVSWKQENNNRMELKLDKQMYKVGDTAHVLVKSPYTNVSALVTYERGDIFAHKIVNINSNAFVVEVPITEKMVPNFFVSVLEFKPADAENLPDFKLGYADVRVDNAAKQLKIGVTPDKQRYGPGDPIKLAITTTDPSGKPLPAEVSVAVVDESVLALKGNPKKDLLKTFYDRRYLGVMTADTLVNLLKRVNVNDLKGAKGGSGKGIDDTLKPRGNFQDTAVWKAQVMTDKNGTASVDFKLPDNLTTWNIEVVGISQDSHVGVTTTSVIAQKPLMVNQLAPRAATYGDELMLGGTVYNYTPDTQNVTVTLKQDGLTVKGDSAQSVSIKSGESKNVTWKISVPYVNALEASAHLTVTAQGANVGDAVEWTLPLHAAITPETVATSAYTDDLSFTEQVVVPANNTPLAGSVTVTTGATLATYVSSALNYLVQYPYGCSEQLVSRIVPMVTIKQAFASVNENELLKNKLFDDKGKPITFDATIQKTLQSIYNAQRSDGGWGYFTESNKSLPYLSAYVVDGLSKVKNAGYSVDAGVLSRGKQFLLAALRSNVDLAYDSNGKPIKTREWAMNRSYMLFVLSESGSGDLALSNSLYEDRTLLSPPAKAYLAMSLKKLGGQSTKIDSLIGDLENAARIDARGTYIRAEDFSGYSMMSNVKATAITLQAFNRIRANHPLTPKVIKWLISQRHDGYWATTQDTSVVLGALVEYMKSSGEAASQYTARVQLNDKQLGNYVVNPKNVLDQHTFTATLNDLVIGNGGNKIIFAKEGTGRLYYDIVFNYFLPAEKIPARSEGFVIQRNYFTLDDTKMAKPVTYAKAGDTLHGHLTIVVPEDRTAVAVENFVPAGFEIVNFDLATADRTVNLNNTQDGSGFYPTGTCDSCDYGKGKGGYGGYLDGYYYGFSNWIHKEVRADRLLLFADQLPRGVYEYDYYVQVTTQGALNNPPAQVSELYYPENFARTAGSKFEVGE